MFVIAAAVLQNIGAVFGYGASFGAFFASHLLLSLQPKAIHQSAVGNRRIANSI